MRCQVSLQSSIELSSLLATLAIVTSTMMTQALESQPLPPRLLVYALLGLPQVLHARRRSLQVPLIANTALCTSPLEDVPSRTDVNSYTLTLRSGPKHMLRRKLYVADVNVMGNLTPRPYLGLASFTSSDAERKRAEEGRTLVDYCYRSFFTLGCYNFNNCAHCHDLPVESSKEWELFKVGVTRVAQRNRVDNRSLNFTAYISTRGLTFADALETDLSMLPSPATEMIHVSITSAHSAAGCPPAASITRDLRSAVMNGSD